MLVERLEESFAPGYHTDLAVEPRDVIDVVGFGFLSEKNLIVRTRLRFHLPAQHQKEGIGGQGLESPKLLLQR